jgi:hypothetical protein
LANDEGIAKERLSGLIFGLKTKRGAEQILGLGEGQSVLLSRLSA